MSEIRIDTDLCKKDGLCAMTCMRSIFLQEEKNTIPKIVDQEHCYGCGQCLAICPQGAIIHSDIPKESVTPVNSENLPDYDQVMELIRSRRSRRSFKKKRVEKEVIEMILEAARYAPSGHNEQTTEFIVIQNEKLLREVGTLTAKGLLKLVGYTGTAIGRTIMRIMLGRRQAEARIEIAPELKGLVAMFNDGKDWILREAPVLILFCADDAGGFSSENANIALHNTALAVETVGLGCFYAGFVVIASGFEDGIGQVVSLPQTHKIYGALALGYPRLKFKKWPGRNPLKVKWLGTY